MSLLIKKTKQKKTLLSLAQMHAFGNGLQNILDVQPGFHGNLKQIIFIFFLIFNVSNFNEGHQRDRHCP